MATFTGHGAASGDDATQVGGGTSAVINGTTASIGTNNIADNPPQIYACRIPSVTIPQGSTIASTSKPQLTLASNAEFITINCTWHGNAVDNCAIFAAAENINTRASTTASVACSENINRVAGTYYGYPTTGDWSGIAQEIINRAGWASGNALGFIAKGTAASNFAHGTVRTWDNATSSPAKLTLDYTAPVTVTPVFSDIVQPYMEPWKVVDY
jgi:hypothetical protein